MTERRGARPPGFWIFVAIAAAGCGLTNLQTARTTPRGMTRTTVGATLVHSSDRGFYQSGALMLPLELMVRHGVTDRFDFGVRLFFGLGALVDLKWNLLSPERRTALSISTGLGGEVPTATIHIPLTVTASHTVRPWFTPYLAVGYGGFWIFNYADQYDVDQTIRYAGRTWTGDGVVMIHAGVELARASGRALFLEYSYARPVVDDPGDFYGFATNQFFSIAFRTGSGNEPTMSR